MFYTLLLCSSVFPAAFRAAIAGELYNQKNADLVGIYLSQVRTQQIRGAVSQAEPGLQGGKRRNNQNLPKH